MEYADILINVEEIVRGVLCDNGIKLCDKTVAGEVPGWDSLNNIRIILAIEKKFNIKYTAEEIRIFQNIGNLCEIIRNRICQ